MQRRLGDLTSLVALISLAPAVVLLCGYFSVAGVTVTNVKSSPVAYLRSTSVQLEDGRIRIWLATQTPPPAGAKFGRTIRWVEHPGFPELDRSVWAFDNHSLTSVLATKGATAYIIAFPIWCALLPCLIAPVLWLKKRRRPRIQVGFEPIYGN